MNEKQCRAVVRERSGGVCERCGTRRLPPTLHHRVKRSHLKKSEQWNPFNCVDLCGHGTSRNGCHSWVESFPNEAEKEGWHVRWWKDPADTPILLHGRTRVFLHPTEPCYIPIELTEDERQS